MISVLLNQLCIELKFKHSYQIISFYVYDENKNVQLCSKNNLTSRNLIHKPQGTRLIN